MRTQFLRHRLVFVSGSSCSFSPGHRLEILHCPNLNYYKKLEEMRQILITESGEQKN